MIPFTQVYANTSILHVSSVKGAIHNVAIPGGQRIPLLVLRMEASCDSEISVDMLSLKHRGMGASSDILSVYSESNGRRLNRGRTIERNGDIDLRLRGLTIPACSDRIVYILGDFSKDAAITGRHQLVLSKIEANAKVMISDVRPSRIPYVAGVPAGNITVEYLQLPKPVRYGESRTVARLRLEADTRYNHLLKSITFTNDGSANDNDLRGIFLEAGRLRRLTNIVSEMDGDRVRLVFNPPLLLKKNKKRLLSLRADVRASRRKTIRFIIEEPGDIQAELVRGRRLER